MILALIPSSVLAAKCQVTVTAPAVTVTATGTAPVSSTTALPTKTVPTTSATTSALPTATGTPGQLTVATAEFPKCGYNGECAEGDSLGDCVNAEMNLDVFWVNSGAFSASIPAGPVTADTIKKAFPHDDALSVVSWTGERLKQHLEFLAVNKSLGKYVQWGGIRFTCDISKPSGQMCYDITVAGKALDAATTYKVGSSDYLTKGSRYVPGPVEGVTLYKPLGEYWVSCLAKKSSVSPTLDGRFKVLNE
ncbi:5'-nucleotidase [Gorgonomyces haynaldii]|nr:5'-nucleotidase [Gorgonomyces haynaldii]